MDFFKKQFSQIHLEKKYTMWRILLVTDFRTRGFHDVVVYGLDKDLLSNTFLGRRTLCKNILFAYPKLLYYTYFCKRI